MKVKSVRIEPCLNGPEPTYDITVPETGFFALDGGYLVKNCDADPDGAHISSLLVGFFVSQMGPLVEDGRLYTVNSPLFRAAVTNSRKRYYGHSLDEIKAKAGADFARCDVSRLKGHGEADAGDIEEYAANPKTRKLIRITSDANTLNAVTAVMGDDVQERKRMLGIEF
jgi:DNA gyrase/topoisomerase IV subunit B